MNAVFSPRFIRLLTCFLVALAVLTLVGADLFAAESPPPGAVISLQANVIMEVVSDRSRLIQVSLVCVVFGCALLWWRR